MIEPYPSTQDALRRFLRLAGWGTLAVAGTLLVYSLISLIASGSPGDELFRLMALNIPLAVLSGLGFGTLVAGLAMFGYRDPTLNAPALRPAVRAAALVGAGAALPILFVYGWLFPGFDRANLTVVTKGSAAEWDWSNRLGLDTADAILWQPGPRWALRGREIGYGDPFVRRAVGEWPFSRLHERWAAAHRLPSVDELVRRCIAGEGRTGWDGGMTHPPALGLGCVLRPLGPRAPEALGYVQLESYEYGALAQRVFSEEYRDYRRGRVGGRAWQELRERVRRRTNDEWRARHGSGFNFAALEPEVREVLSRYRAAALYHPYRLVADALWPLVLGPLGVLLGFWTRARAGSAVAQRLGLVGAATVVVLAVAFLGWAGPRVAVVLRALPPLAAALAPPILMAGLAFVLYALIPGRLDRLRDVS